MAGEIIKGSVYLNNLGKVHDNPNANMPFANTIGGENLTEGYFELINSVNNSSNDYDVTNNKLAVSLTKQFQTKQVTFDANVPPANVSNTILDAINVWIAGNGKAYDDIIITINPSGANHDIMVCIIRYF